MKRQTLTARLDKISRRNETVRVSNVFKHNGEFTKSRLETLNYLLDILLPGSQQTENHATENDLVDNPFMRPEDTEMMAKHMFIRAYGSSYYRIPTIQSSRARKALSCAVTERLESTKKILPCHFSSLPETQLCAIGMENRHRQYLECRGDTGVRIPHRELTSPHRDLGVLPPRVERWKTREKIASQD